MLRHMENLYHFYGDKNGVHIARKHVSWYSKGQPHGGGFRNIFNRLETAEEQLQLADQFFLSLIENQDLILV
jgi:tRNA-dihydrouridine synthase B